MKQSLAWLLLAQFNTTERREFREFLASPYFNKREDVQLLYKMIEWHLNKHKIPTKERLYEALHEAAPYDDQSFRLLNSYLYKLATKYIAHQKLAQDHHQKTLLHLSYFHEHNLDKHFLKTINKTVKLQGKHEHRNPEFHWQRWQVEREQYRILSKSGRSQVLNFQQMEDELTIAFYSMKLRQACYARAHESVMNIEYKTHELTQILENAQKWLNIPAIQIYHQCYLALFANPTEQNFQQFRKLLLDNTPLFPAEEIRNLYLLAINFCIKQINQNKGAYLNETLSLYSQGIENGTLLENEQLSRYTYNNVVSIALKMGEYTFAESFVEKYRPFLSTKYRIAAYSLNTARLAFAQQHFDKTLLALQKVDYQDIINNMIAKTLQMKAYFEMEEFDLLDNLLNTMQMFIRRNRKMSYHHENWSNIIYFTKKLIELNQFDREEQADLYQEIENTEILTEKGWLLSKINQH